MKRIAFLLSLCLLVTACGGGQVPEAPGESPMPDAGQSAESAPEPPPPQEALDPERLNEIMCIFGAKRRTHYDAQGQPVESGPVQYETSVISFYYGKEGISGAEAIAPYWFYGWYVTYTSTREEKIRGVLPDFEPSIIARTTPISGDIYGAPADSYEPIVTAFFDVDVQQLRGDDLYDEEARAYVPNSGPGLGVPPTVRIVEAEQRGELLIMDIAVEDRDEPAYTLELTVREDESNPFEGIRFVSLLPVPQE